MMRQKDDEHIRLLSIFHFLVAGLSMIGLAFVCIHAALTYHIILQPEVQTSKAFPTSFLPMFIVGYVLMGLICVAFGIANCLSALYMKRRKHRIFSLVMGGINCIQFPLGTTLGVFTFLVLSRPSVIATYTQEDGGENSR